jgi:hypothetical protein
MVLGRDESKPMRHSQVIEDFVQEGKQGRGTLVNASGIA